MNNFERDLESFYIANSWEIDKLKGADVIDFIMNNFKPTIYSNIEDISLLSLKSEEELAWLHTKLASKFSDNTVLMQKLEQLEGKKYNAGITYKSTNRKLFE